jgi:SAM-dependent methyltransferase
MRRTWDALAGGDTAVYVGDPATGVSELEGLFGRLHADPRGGTCVEVGCGPGRMTGALAERFDRVVAVDVSPAMLEQARATVTVPNVTFLEVPGDRLEGVESASADVLVCYLVLQHLPSGEVVRGYLKEFARVLAPRGEAFVQVPVLDGAAGRLRRVLRTPLLRLARRPEHGAAFRGFRLTRRELAEALDRAGLKPIAEDEGPSAYRRSRDRFLRLVRR